MTTQNKSVTVYLPKNVEGFIARYCNEYGITRKDKEGNVYPSLGTGIIELLKLLAYNPESVGSPLPDNVPSIELEATTQRLDNCIDALSGRLNDWILAIDDRLSDCEQGLSGKITSLENRLNALAIRLDSQETTQEIDDKSPLIQSENKAANGEPISKAFLNINQCHKYLKEKGCTDTSHHLLKTWIERGGINPRYAAKNFIFLRDGKYYPRLD